MPASLALAAILEPATATGPSRGCSEAAVESSPPAYAATDVLEGFFPDDLPDAGFLEGASEAVAEVGAPVINDACLGCRLISQLTFPTSGPFLSITAYASLPALSPC
jgi:hypothetical protein